MNNYFHMISVPPNTPTVVAGFPVPARGGYSFKGCIIWTDTDCEVVVKHNVDTIGGGRINSTTQTLHLDYSGSPYGLNENDVIAVLATQTDSSPHTAYCTLLLEQL